VTNPQESNHQAAGMINLLGNSQPLFRHGSSLSEHTQLSLALGELRTSVHAGQICMAEVLVSLLPVERQTVCLKQSIASR
jgi:hypothetical protein